MVITFLMLWTFMSIIGLIYSKDKMYEMTTTQDLGKVARFALMYLPAFVIAIIIVAVLSMFNQE